jgi:hypothetical protein
LDIKSLTYSERDEFRRKGIADNLISILRSNIDVSPMVIDGSWGTGKTEFCHKLINLMKADDTHHLIYIDAFKADHADEPLMTVLAEVIKVLPDDDSKKTFMKKVIPAVRYGIKTSGSGLVSYLLKQDVADVVDGFDKAIQKTADKAIDATVESVLKDHVKADQNLKALQTALAEIAATKSIIIFIDELDRCRPNFAVDMLEVIKHTFDVQQVSFVLITNSKQLKASINHCYGQTVDSQRYLDKFVKFTMTLPEIVDIGSLTPSFTSIEYYKTLVKKSSILGEFTLSDDGSIRTLSTFIKVNNLSLREVESIVRHIEIYSTLTDKRFLTKGTVLSYMVLTVLAIAICCIKPEVANSILLNKLDADKFGQLLGVDKLSSLNKYSPNETELICYAVCNAAYKKSLSYQPKEDIEVWHTSLNAYLEGPFMVDDSAGYTICSDAIQALTMC